MTQLVKRAPPSIPQHLRGIIEDKRSQSLYNQSCERSALMMPRTCCGIDGGARVTNRIIRSVSVPMMDKGKGTHYSTKSAVSLQAVEKGVVHPFCLAESL
jgi:hypothetical protein